MQRTRIEWCDYTVNPVKGLCPVDCKDNLKPTIFKDAQPAQFALDKGFLNWKGELRHEFPRLGNKL